MRRRGGAFDLAGLGELSLKLGIHEKTPGVNEVRRDQVGGEKLDADGRAVFEHVALDRFYSARISGLLKRYRVGAGPTSNHPDQVVQIIVPSDLVFFVGRALDAEGQSLVEQTISIHAKRRLGFSSRQASTGADGEFVMPRPSLKPGLEVEISGQRRVPATPKWSFHVKEPRVVQGGRNDLGDIRFVPAPLVLSGRLVVPEALEEIEKIHWWVEKNQGRSWRPDYGFETTWAESRQFEIRGPVDEGETLRLDFGRGGYLPLDPREFKVGTEGVEIAIEQAGSVTLKCLIDSGLSEVGLVAALARAGASDEVNWLLAKRVDLTDQGKGVVAASWRGLEAGTYHLRVESPGAAEPFVFISNISVAAGSVEDTRLRNVDLRGRLMRVEIAVFTQAGAPFDQRETYVLVAESSGEYWHGHYLRAGKTSLVVTPGATVRVLARGHVLAELNDVRGDQVVRMRPSPVQSIRVQWPVALPEGVSSQVLLRPILEGMTRSPYLSRRGSKGSINNYWEAGGIIDANGNASVSPMVPGRQRVLVVLDPHGRRWLTNDVTPAEIVWGPESGEEIVIAVDEVWLRRALKLMKR